MQHLPRGYAAIAYCGIYILNIAHVKALKKILIIAFFSKLAKLPALPLCSFGKHFLASYYVLFPVRFFEPLAYLSLGLLRFYDFQPITARRGVWRGHYLANVVVFKLVVQPYYGPVHLCMLNVVAYV